MDVGDWLRTLGLQRYEAIFRENDVSGEVLGHLTADDLKELGVAGVGHRRQLLVAIAAMRLLKIPFRCRHACQPTRRMASTPRRPLRNAAHSA
jgi:hypothetical protein